MRPTIKLRQVSAFLEIVRLGSFKDAAEALHLTQPAISRSVRELEESLGARLLLRDRGGVSLTREGEVFHQFAQLGMQSLQQAVDRTVQQRSGLAGRIAIGALPSVAARLLPEAIQRFAELAPGAQITIEDGAHGHLLDRLRASDLDVVVGRLGPPETMQAVSFTQLYLEQVSFVVRPGHRLCGNRDIRAIAGSTLIYPPSGAAIRPLVDRLMIANGVEAACERIETVSGAFGRNLASVSDAIWVISDGVVDLDIAGGRLERLPFDTVTTAGPVGIMVRAGEEPEPMVRLFDLAVSQAVEASRPGAAPQ